jgi:hypothetical protein
MLEVTVNQKNEAGKPVEVGTIEYHGVQVLQPSGGTRMPMEGGKPVPFRAALEPKGFLSDEVVEQIHRGLAGGFAKGMWANTNGGRSSHGRTPRGYLSSRYQG